MSAKQYAVQAQGQRSAIREPIYYTDDLDGPSDMLRPFQAPGLSAGHFPYRSHP
jgi:hypothetical protein